MLKSNLLCFCLPTCNKEDMFKYLLPSLKNIGELKNYCCFSITFQPPYEEEDIKKVLREFDNLNLNYKYEYQQYEFERGKTPLIQMRNDCALRYPKALFYGMLDDDMQFLDGIDRDYLNVLNYLLGNRNCSVALFLPPIHNDEASRKFNMGLEYADFENTNYFTESGLIYRGGIYYGFDGLMPQDMLQYVGGRQDTLIAIWRILKGESSILTGNARCKHYQHRQIAGHSEYDWLNNSNFSTPTCLSWLESVGYIKHILGIFGGLDSDYTNFSEAKCKELYEKGCKSSLMGEERKLQYRLIDVSLILPELNEKLNNLDLKGNQK